MKRKRGKRHSAEQIIRNPRDPVHAIAAERKRKNRDFFRDLVASAGATDPESFADRYTALVEGTLVLRQVRGRDDAANVIKPAVASLVAEALPGWYRSNVRAITCLVAARLTDIILLLSNSRRSHRPGAVSCPGSPLDYFHGLRP